jgi:hypothetical protein
MTTSLTTVNEPITWVVSYRAAWGDEWTVATDLHPTEVTFALAPAMPTATLVRDYGRVWELGASNSPRTVLTLDLRGKYIRIQLIETQADGTQRSMYWYGYCPAPVDKIDGTRSVWIDGAAEDVAKGQTTFTCYALEWLLQEAIFRQAEARTAAGTYQTVLHGMTFNGWSKRRVGFLDGNRSYDVKTGTTVYVFSGESNRVLWTALDVLNYLLYQWYVDTGSKLLWEVVGAEDLDNLYDVWEFDGLSYLEALQRLINPGLGLTFYVDVNTETNKARINVVSVSEEDILDEDEEVLVTGNGTSLSLEVARSGGIRDCTVKHLEMAHYDSVEVRGAPLRVMFTVAGSLAATLYSNAVLQNDWTADLETAYKAATDAQRRGMEKYEAVYCRLKLAETWNQYANLAIATPKIDPLTGQVKLPLEKAAWYPWDKSFDRVLPLKDDQGQWRKPFAIWSEDNLNFRRMDRPGDNLKAQGLTVLDNALGIQLEPHSQPNHIVAKNVFTNASDVTPEWDYRRLLATLSVYTDEPVRVSLATAVAEPGELTRVKVIEMPWAEVWYVIPGTIKDFDPAQSGAAAFSVADNTTGEYARDDSAKLRQAAYLAKHWYGRVRQILELTYGVPYCLDTLLGVMVTDLANGEATVPVNTVLSELRYNLGAERQTLLVRTSFYQLDISRLLRPKGRSGGSFRRAGGYDGSAELCHIPSRIGSAGGGSVYTGQFAVVLKAGTTNTVTVGAGRIVAGTTVSTVAATDNTPSGAAGTYYLYSESYFTTSWVHGYASSTTYPTQAVKTVSSVDYPCFRKLIAELTWSGTAVTAIMQQQYGEIHIAGRSV